jgi:hypothetical protein
LTRTLEEADWLGSDDRLLQRKIGPLR